MKATIGLDAGHGGSSSGTYSCNSTKDGLFEKDFCLELALLVEERLLKNGFGVVVTRRTDKNPGTVNERAQKMIEQGVDFALSLHFNGFGTQSANGTEVFVPHEEKLAGIETGFHGGLGKFFKRRTPFARANSYYNRNAVFDKKLNVESRRFEAVLSEKDYFGFVRTCWSAGISADLLEVCFLTNPSDFKAYTEHREEIADGIAKSIVEAFGEEYVGLETITLEEQGKQKEDVKPSVTAKPRIGRALRGNRFEMVK